MKKDTDRKNTGLQKAILIGFLCFAAGPAFAIGFDKGLSILHPGNLGTATDATESGDYCYRWDADEANTVKVDCTDASFGDDITVGDDLVVVDDMTVDAISATGTLTLDDGTGASPSFVMTDETNESLTISKVDAGFTTFTTVAGDGVQVTTGNLKVGNGTPGVTQDGEDAYVEGTLEVDGASEFDGAVDFDSTITVGTTTINTVPITAQARGMFTICGDATTVNNNTVYYGPSQVLTSSATAGSVVCDTTAAGNTTEATADAPVLAATAIYPLGMQCWQPDSGNTITYTLRSAEAAITPAISVSIADNILVGTANATATAAIASGATVAVAVASTGDIGTIPFRCDISYAY